MSNSQLVVFATSINQVKFAKEVIRSEYSESRAILLLADPTTYNEIPNHKFFELDRKNDEIFEKIIYINKLIDFENLTKLDNLIKVGELIEEQGIIIKDVKRLFIGLLSAKLYINFANLFFNAKISIFSDGMMTFGPLRGDIYKLNLDKRIDSLFYEDLCDGIVPKYLPEIKIKVKKIKVEYPPLDKNDDNKVLIALQSLSYSRILNKEEEFCFYKKYINEICRLYCDKKIYILPHPNNSSMLLKSIHGNNIEYLDNTLSGEEYVKKYGITTVASVFSTLMFRVRKMGVKCFSFGTDEIYLKLSPFENSNRIPIILSRYFFPHFDGLTSITSKDVFISNLHSYRPDIDFINKLLEATSILIKQELADKLNKQSLDVLDRLPIQEKDLLLSRGGQLVLKKFNDFEYTSIESPKATKDISIEKKANLEINNPNLINQITILKKQIHEEKERRERIKNSISWRVTKPIRFLGSLIK